MKKNITDAMKNILKALDDIMSHHTQRIHIYVCAVVSIAKSAKSFRFIYILCKSFHKDYGVIYKKIKEILK